jgi:hypothetical protein
MALGFGVALICIVLGFTSLWGLRFTPWAEEGAARAHQPAAQQQAQLTPEEQCQPPWAERLESGCDNRPTNRRSAR